MTHWSLDMRLIGLGILILLTTLAWLASPRESNITLVADGVSRATIVVSPKASDQVRFAARELQAHLKIASGAEIKIVTDNQPHSGVVISVGHTSYAEKAGIDAARLRREGFVIETRGGNLALVGRDDDGTQFAVYEFLERQLGVRWYWPGELGEVVPKSNSVVIGKIESSQQPDFAWRNRGPGGALWGSATGPVEMHERERLLGISEEHQAQVRLWEKRTRWGGLKIYGGHSLGEVFPPEKYAKTHPEYYALINGNRAVPGPDYDYKHGGQVCTTEPGVIRVAVEWARKFFDTHPDYDGVHLTMNDGGGFCQCDRCRALDSARLITQTGIDTEEMKKNPGRYSVITDRIYTYLNQVAEEVQKTHPGKYIVSMAYSRYIEPPERIRLHPWLIPQYCLWSAYRHANAELKRRHQEVAAGWARAALRKGIYEYDINGSWPGLHRIVTSFIADSIQYLHSQGFDLYQTQSGDDFAINGMNYYITSRLLWDSSADARKIMDEFYEKAFGRAGQSVRQFHQRLNEAWRKATQNGNDVTCSTLKDTRLLQLFTPQLLQQCTQDLLEAEKAADDDLVRKRVGFYKKGFQYTQMTVKAVDAAKKLEAFGIDPVPQNEVPRQLDEAAKQKARKLVQQALIAWEQRDQLVEGLKNDYVLAYFWIKYNDSTRDFNPKANLRKLAF